MRVLPLLLLGPALLISPATADTNTGTWTALEPGLELGVFDSPVPSILGDGRVRVVRVDPEHYDVVVLCASEHDKTSRTAKAWSAEFDLSAAINASMFDTDWLSSVSYLRAGTHINSPKLTADNTVLVSTPRQKGNPRFQILDRECDDLESGIEGYEYAVQSIRMLSCKGKNVWSQQPKMWSHAITGIDKQGRLLLIHARSPWSTHDFIEILRQLPLDLARLQYGDGGPPAQLYVRAGDQEQEFVGSYETGIKESDSNDYAWKLPNVIGVRRRPAKAP